MFSERKQLTAEMPANQATQAVSDTQALQANQAKQPSSYKCDTSAKATIRSLVVTTRGYERSRSVTKSMRARSISQHPSHTHKSRDRSVRSPSTKRRRSPSIKRRHSRSPSHNHRRHRSPSCKRHRSRDNSQKNHRDTPPRSYEEYHRDMRRDWKY